MRQSMVWGLATGSDRAVVERVTWEIIEETGDEEVVLVVHARPRAREASRCGVCRLRSPREDSGEGRRRWRCLDLGCMRTYLEADAPRVRCKRHGRVVAAVPWARHAARHTREFDTQVAWLAATMNKTAIAELMRVGWHTVGVIVERVCADQLRHFDPLAGLQRIGIDEISYRKHHNYLTVVVDHDSGRLVWAGAGRDKAVVKEFFDLLGADRTAQITHVSADGASWISSAVTACAPQAVQCTDPFYGDLRVMPAPALRAC